MTPIRLLTARDIPSAMKLKDAAGWNQTETDWRNVLALAPDGCFALDVDGVLVATATAVCFGRDLAWIGMVLTDPAYRGRGFARRIMEHSLEYLRGRGVRWIKLDATDMGRPLYERLGFRDECVIERWIRKAGNVVRPHDATSAFAMDRVLDRDAFGADRSKLLQTLAAIESCSIAGGGFAMGRPGSKAAFFGPCVSRSIEPARDLVAWFLGRHAGESVYWDILPANADAVALATEYGFERARELVRMSLSETGAEPLGNDDSLVFGTAGFEYG
jgi:GNAT superfamily N-acetyltransferase